MTRRDSISTEIVRAELRRDCEAAGYSASDADALAGRIIDGWLFPGLAIALEGRGVSGGAWRGNRDGQGAGQRTGVTA